MFASIDVASPDLPRRMSSKACLTVPKSGPEAAVGAAGGAESFECSATGVTRPDSLRATSVGRGRGRGMDLGLASETVPSASQAKAVAKARVEATAVPGNFSGPDGGTMVPVGSVIRCGSASGAVSRSGLGAGGRSARSHAIAAVGGKPAGHQQISASS